MNRFIIIIFLGLCFNSCWGQTKHEIDSLTDLCYSSFYSDPEKSLKLAERVYKLADKIDYAYGKSSALSYLARSYYINFSNYDTALVLLNRALIIDSLGGEMSDVLVDYTQIASLYKTKGDLVESTRYNYLALRIARENQYRIYEASILFSLGGTFSMLKEPLNAEKNYLEALEVVEKMIDSGKDPDPDYTKSVTGHLYVGLVDVYLNSPELWEVHRDEVFDYLQLAQVKAIELEDFYIQAEVDHYLSKYYQLKKEFTKALKFADKAVKGAQLVERPHEEAKYRLLIVEIYLELEQINKAKDALAIVIDLCLKNEHHLLRVEALALLSKIYLIEGDYEMASLTLAQKFALNDSILGLTEKSEIREEELNFRIVSEQNKSLLLENELLERKGIERRITYLAVGLGILLVTAVVIVFFILRLRKTKRELFKAEVEQKVIQDQLEISALEIALLSAQMKPHFTFNVLNSIQYLIVSEQPDKAIKYLSEFARFLRRTLEYSNQPIISLQEEIEIVESYLSLEQLRFKEKLTYTIEISKEINTEQLNVPSLFLQPFVENSILHGFNHDGSGHILIDVRAKLDSVVEILIQDNGINENGLNESISKDKKSMGIDITRKRLTNLNMHNSVEICENEHANGVSVKIKLHLSD